MLLSRLLAYALLDDRPALWQRLREPEIASPRLRRFVWNHLENIKAGVCEADAANAKCVVWLCVGKTPEARVRVSRAAYR